MRHFLTLADFTPDEFASMLALGEKLKAENKQGIRHHLLKGKSLGMIFSKSSTRTRVSFEVGMYQLGGQALFLNQNDIQLGRGESIYDTANVLSRFLDGIMIRTYDQADIEDLAKHGQIPIINGLTDYLHPTQIVADLITVHEVKGKLEGLNFAYLGDGNNVANSLLHGCALVGANIKVASPHGYTCAEKVIEEAKSIAAKTGATITMTSDPEEAATNADVIITDTWTSMGQEEEKQERIKIFSKYQVNDHIMRMTALDSMFLHCLPAYRGYEVTTSVIDGERSFIFDEAENRMHAHKAILVKCLGE